MQSIVEAVALWAETQPDRFCLADEKRELTYGQYWEQIAGYALYLKEQGVKRGDCVLVRNSQNIDFVTAGLAVQLLGAVFVPLEKNIAEHRVLELYEEVSAVYYIANREPELSVSFLPLGEVSQYSKPVEKDRFVFPEEEELAEILFTTGTTGKSKGIELLHKNVVAVAQNVIEGVEMKADNVELIPVPLSHSHGLRRYYSNMKNGSGAVLLDGVVFVNKIFSCIEKYHVTAMDLVPAALSALLKLGGTRLGEWKDRIDYVQLGSAPIPEQDKEKLMQLLPKSRLYNFYGTTESGCSCILDFNKDRGIKNCIGYPTCHAEFIFLDEDGKRIDSDKDNPGFLACKGDMNMRGYYNSPELNAKTFWEGFIVTQDLAYQGEDGKIYLLGRKGDVIQSGGNKISPQEIEEVVLLHEGIRDCACIPVESQILGQEPKLFYVTETDVDLEEDELYRFLKSKLETYKVPKQLEKLDEIPRTYNGKIRRNLLMEIENRKGE